MKLYRKLIDERPFVSEEVSGIYEYTLAETLPSGFEECDTIEDWDKYGHHTGKDYKVRRKEIQTRVYTKILGNPDNWDMLTLAEKKIASKYFLVPRVLRDTVHTDLEQNNNGLIFDEESCAVRSQRYKMIKPLLYNRLEMEDANEVIDDMWEIYAKVNGKEYTRSLVENYIMAGREGTLEGDPEGIFDYVLARTGTSFEHTGLLQKGFVTTYGTLQELCNKFIDILKNGNY